MKQILWYPFAGRRSHTPVQFPPSETGFLWKGVPSCPTGRDSQGPSLCFPSFPHSLIFSHRINSIPFPLSCPLRMYCHETTVWTVRGDLFPVLGPLGLSRVAGGGRRKNRRKSKKKQWFGGYRWPPPEEERGNVDMSLFRSTLVKYISVGALPKCPQKLDRKEGAIGASNHWALWGQKE